MNPRILSTWSRMVVALTLLLTLLPVAAGASPLPGNLTPVAPIAPVAPTVLEQLTASGEATYWVVLSARADLSPAYDIADWDARGTYVYETLTQHAARTQAGLIAELVQAGAKYQSYWILNSIRVTSGAAVLDTMRTNAAVAEILADEVWKLPRLLPAEVQEQVNGIEWNVDRIGAPRVWNQYGVRGEGIVVASIDVGVEYQHPALVQSYRGNLGGGGFDHSYNWYDPTLDCGDPSNGPCDSDDHGTHTMGTMVGEDAENHIGVAPGARWIAAKGCGYEGCAESHLTAAAQWMLAPTDLNGENPRPDLRPHVLNNSWGQYGSDPWFQSYVQAWAAAGIFPAFSAGNAGPWCSTVGSPGDYPESYSSGAFGANDLIADFSSRGPSTFAQLRPNLAAPGVDVRSSVRGGAYAQISGTSMASPHTAATVALMWSAAPTLSGDIAATIELLDATAVDVDDTSCGGTPEKNNVWGEGRLDAFAAVTASPRGTVGSLEGTVTDAATGQPVVGASVHVEGPLDRMTQTDSAGFYRFPALSIGDYTIGVHRFAYLDRAAGTWVAEGMTTVSDFDLSPAPTHRLAGHVRDEKGRPMANIVLTLLNTPVASVTTDAAGTYAFPTLPEGSYEMKATGGSCYTTVVRSVALTRDETAFDFTLAQHLDDFHYGCAPELPAYIEAEDVFDLSGDDQRKALDLPFEFSFYGTPYDEAWVSTNGWLAFADAGNSAHFNYPIPDVGTPNAAIYPFWTDLVIAAGGMRTQYLTNGPLRAFVIEWRGARLYGSGVETQLDFEVVLYEDGQILTQYRHVDNVPLEQGSSATIGIENESGTVAFQYSYNQPALANTESAIRYRARTSVSAQGTVRDANDGAPIFGAVVRATESNVPSREVTTDAAGYYQIPAYPDETILEASSPGYATQSALVTSTSDAPTPAYDFYMPAARGEASRQSLLYLLHAGASDTQTLILRNTGGLDMAWIALELGSRTPLMVASALPAAAPTTRDPEARTTEGMSESQAPLVLPAATGQVLRSWMAMGMGKAWGAGYDGEDVWLSDATQDENREYRQTGEPTGAVWPADFGGAWPADMAYDASRGWMCQVNVGGDNGIHCWNAATGNPKGAIAGDFAWTMVSQRGLAYRPDDDSFYIGGWNEGILYHIAGFSHAVPGEVLDACLAPDPVISGLAWNASARLIWIATNSREDRLYAVDPEQDCATIGALAHPDPYFNGGGLELDAVGNLWMVGVRTNRAYLVDGGIPMYSDVPWLSVEPASGVLPPGGQQEIRVTASRAGLPAGVYTGQILFRTNGARTRDLPVSVSMPERVLFMSPVMR